MTIVIQHEYYHLSVNINDFNNGLSFNNKKSGVKTSDIDSSGALDIDAGTGDVTIDSSSGSITMGAALTDGQTLKLGKNGATEMIFTPHGTAGSEKISLTNTALTEKTIEIAQKFPKIAKKKEISLIEKIAKKSVIYNRR